MKIPLLLLLGSLMSSSAQNPSPQSVVPRKDLNQELRWLWSPSGLGCGKLNYHLYAYTGQYPERVKFAGEDEVANVEGFVDYLAAISPVTVRVRENGTTFSLGFYEGKLFTPWGDEIYFLFDRNKDGYLSAFGAKKSVNHFADPWELKGFQYSKAVGIALRKTPAFFETGGGAPSIMPLNDNDHKKDITSAPAAATVNEADPEGPQKAASLFFAACRAQDLDALRKLITRHQLEAIKRKRHSLEWWAGLWGAYQVETIDGSDPISRTPDGRATTEVNFTISDQHGRRPGRVSFRLEDNQWKMDEN